MSFDAAYEALTDHEDDARWAYGTGFADPLAGVSTAVPDGVDRADLTAYCLMLGDDALVMSHRLQQWVTRAPELEDELAIANIGLDLLGQARLLLTRAAEVEGRGRDEDALAYLRDPSEFRNVRLAERADDNFAHLVARLLVFATWRLALLDRLASSRDPVLAAIGAKGVKELTYHREYAAGWVVRLGDGTDLSHKRMRTAMTSLWPLTAELFVPHRIEQRLSAAGVAVDPTTLRPEFDTVLAEVCRAATLPLPTAASVNTSDSADAALASTTMVTTGGVSTNARASFGGAAPDARPGSDAVSGGATPSAATGGGAPHWSDEPRDNGDGSSVRAGDGVAGLSGRAGKHGEELVAILAEMQALPRALPGGVW